MARGNKSLFSAKWGSELCWKRCLLSTAQIMEIPCAEDKEMSHRTSDGAFAQPWESRPQTRLRGRCRAPLRSRKTNTALQIICKCPHRAKTQ